MKVTSWPGGPSQWLHDFSKALPPWLSSISWFCPPGVSAPVLVTGGGLAGGPQASHTVIRGSEGLLSRNSSSCLETVLHHRESNQAALILRTWTPLSEVKSLGHVQLFATPWTIAYQAPQSMEFSRQEKSPYPPTMADTPGLLQFHANLHSHFQLPHKPTLICHNPESLQQSLSLNLPPSPLGKHFHTFCPSRFDSQSNSFVWPSGFPQCGGLLFPRGLDLTTASRDIMRPYFYLSPTGPELL